MTKLALSISAAALALAFASPASAQIAGTYNGNSADGAGLQFTVSTDSNTGLLAVTGAGVGFSAPCKNSSVVLNTGWGYGMTSDIVNRKVTNNSNGSYFDITFSLHFSADGGAVAIAFVSSLFVAIFMVEFAPAPLRRVLEPVVRVLASVPPVVYGLIGVIVLVPFIGNHLISLASKASVTPIIQLNGQSLLAAWVVLGVMISPIMIAIFAEGLRSVPRGHGSRARWRSGSTRWRTYLARSPSSPRGRRWSPGPCWRPRGRSASRSMLSDDLGLESAFAPNPADGLIFFYEPSRRASANDPGTRHRGADDRRR